MTIHHSMTVSGDRQAVGTYRLIPGHIVVCGIIEQIADLTRSEALRSDLLVGFGDITFLTHSIRTVGRSVGEDQVLSGRIFNVAHYITIALSTALLRISLDHILIAVRRLDACILAQFAH